MSWIRSIAPEQATGDAAAAFQRLRAQSGRGHVSNFWQAMGLDPTALGGMVELRAAIMDAPAPLTASQAESIALVVSAVNGCGYSVAHHGRRLVKTLGDEALARAVARDYREADLSARDRVLLDYAVALTCEPSERKAEDVERLREYGFDDAAILKATEITAYYNAVNRILSGLGVPLEADVPPWQFGAQR